MQNEQYYEVEGAVFREAPGSPMEVYSERRGAWIPYEGDRFRVTRLSNPMSLEEVKPYMGQPQAEDNQEVV